MNRTLIGLVLFVASVGIGFGLMLPQSREVRLLTNEVKALDQIRLNKEKRLADLKQLQSVFATKQTDIDTIISALPQEPQMPEVLVTLEAMIKESGVSFSSLSPQINAKNGEVNGLINGEGDLGQIEKIAEVISLNNRPMSVTSVNLTKKENNKLSFSLNILIPFLVPDVVVPTVPVTAP